MTGAQIVQALIAALRAAAPEYAVREAFLGDAARRPLAPELTVGLLGETEEGGARSAKIGVWLYRPARCEVVELLPLVQGAAQAAGCAVQVLALGETSFDRTLGCLVCRCTLTVALDGVSFAYINGAAHRIADYTVSMEEKERSYGAVGEEIPPYTVRTRTYTVALSGVQNSMALLVLENFAVSVGGVRYAPCAWKRISGNTLTFTAPYGEAVTQDEKGE